MKLFALATWTLTMLFLGAFIAWRLPRVSPAVDTIALTISACGEPQWVVFVDAGTWEAEPWATVRSRSGLSQRYLARERGTLNMGCPGGHR